MIQFMRDLFFYTLVFDYSIYFTTSSPIPVYQDSLL